MALLPCLVWTDYKSNFTTEIQWTKGGATLNISFISYDYLSLTGGNHIWERLDHIITDSYQMIN